MDFWNQIEISVQKPRLYYLFQNSSGWWRLSSLVVRSSTYWRSPVFTTLWFAVAEFPLLARLPFMICSPHHAPRPTPHAPRPTPTRNHIQFHIKPYAMFPPTTAKTTEDPKNETIMKRKFGNQWKFFEKNQKNEFLLVIVKHDCKRRIMRTLNSAWFIPHVQALIGISMTPDFSYSTSLCVWYYLYFLLVGRELERANKRRKINASFLQRM
jgi:hypothetical protein